MPYRAGITRWRRSPSRSIPSRIAEASGFYFANLPMSRPLRERILSATWCGF